MKPTTLERLRKLAAEEPHIGSEDFCPDDFAGGNIDDAWQGGMSDGEKCLASEILPDVEALKKSHDLLAHALAVYADRAQWEDLVTGIGAYPGNAIDYGVTARVALEESKAVLAAVP
jgi:hypothetical protein